MNSSKVFCSVDAGINTCSICYNSAFFSRNLSQRLHETLPAMELFKCGHGMCKNCWNQMKTSSTDMKCPFCRKDYVSRVANFNYAVLLSLESRGVIDAKDVPSPTKEIHTFDEFLEEWEDRMYLLSRCQHQFMILYRHIIHTEKSLLGERIKHQKEQKKKLATEERKQKRKLSRQSAICHICNKDTFTSEKQLNVHIKAKHG